MSFEYDAEKTCSQCGGDGGWDAPEDGRFGHLYDDVTGSLITRWRKCSACDGKGTVTVHVRPIDFEDLADVHGDDDDPYSVFAYRGGNP